MDFSDSREEQSTNFKPPLIPGDRTITSFDPAKHKQESDL
jgi:hypothetical protein